MGIPHLISTLEPFAVHGVLDGNHVVIDGPALAYHILYICNRHGVTQPSYQLLGDTTIAWLDELVRRCVSVDAIYFDGHLPLAKRPVRMERMRKSLNQLKGSYSGALSGFSPSFLSTTRETSPELFSSSRPTGKPFLPPSFHVPAIIEALRSCPRYSKLVRLVPSEADVYCAQHLSESGGIVLTSDSDLLVHDVGSGRVVFIRDIYVDGQSSLGCASFSPAQICERLKIAFPSGICRLAYERKHSPHLTLPQILRDCAQPVVDAGGYTKFCHEYLDNDTAPLPTSRQSRSIHIESLDPRISELILQLGHKSDLPDDTQEDKIFLPILLESPARGSAWEPSTPIRQLAYTVARWIIPGPSSSVQEYRRVNTVVQKGRQVLMFPREAAKAWANDLIGLMSRTIAATRGDTRKSWQVLCLTMDVRYCHEEGKHSHALQILEESSRKPSFKRVSWDVIHFAAQLQASYYSLRILKQILSLDPAKEFIPELHEMLSSLPPLEEAPGIESVVEFLQHSGEAGTVKTISRLVPLPNLDVDAKPKPVPSPKKRKIIKEQAQKRGGGVTKPATRNLFDVLSGSD
ncbi:hypothetical protein ACJZ2D_000025 [Fusarium nematophilum]